jgi:hypothetical protein
MTHAMSILPLPDIQNLQIDQTAQDVEKCSRLLVKALREDLSILNTQCKLDEIL